jgi:hypothetical protein
MVTPKIAELNNSALTRVKLLQLGERLIHRQHLLCPIRRDQQNVFERNLLLLSSAPDSLATTGIIDQDAAHHL